MNILEFIAGIEDEELAEFVKERIEFLEEDDSAYIPSTIGYNLDYNPSSFNLVNFDIEEEKKVQMISSFNGYIPKQTRIVYGMVYDEKTLMKSNGGRYYYIDDDTYILDFCKFIKDKGINNPYVLFDYVYEFIQDYFGRITLIDREKMMDLVLKKDQIFYDPINENKFSMFKNKGNALCSEIGLMAQNILSFLGFDIKYIIGTEKIGKYDTEGHAYNMICFEEEGEEVSILIDFSSSVCVLDFSMKKTGEAPFIHYLNEDKEIVYQDMMMKDKSIKANNYSYLIQGKVALVIEQEEYEREYKTSTNLKNAEKTLRKKLK